ncbi:MAG: molybdopterin-guanine dinucleotide biosynthesis protein B [Candidatus Methanomethyliaceae archaeon]
MSFMSYAPPVICIAAFGRKYGKTTIIQGITKILTSKGVRVSIIKHSVHHIRGDSGKDTDRFMASGALASAVLTNEGEGVLYLSKSSLNNLISIISHLGVDLILCEGFKSSPYPKLVIVRSTEELQRIEALEGVIGIIFDAPTQGEIGLGLKVPVLNKDPSTIASFILSYIRGCGAP